MKLDDPVRKSIEAKAEKLGINVKKIKLAFCKDCGEGIELIDGHWRHLSIPKYSHIARPEKKKIKKSKPGASARQDQRKEAVDHPAHYGGDTMYEVIKVLRAWGLLKNFCLGNAIKYIARHDKKERSLEDLKKAAWYLNFEIQEMEASERTVT